MNFTRLLTATVATVVAAGSGFAQQPVAPKTAPLPAQTQVTVAPFDVTVARRISAEDVKKRIDAGDKVTIIDTRSKFSGPMAKGAQLVPVDKVPDWSKDLPKDTFIVAYCT